MCAGFFGARMLGWREDSAGLGIGAVKRAATAAYPAASKSLTYLCSTLYMSAW